MYIIARPLALADRPAEQHFAIVTGSRLLRAIESDKRAAAYRDPHPTTHDLHKAFMKLTVAWGWGVCVDDTVYVGDPDATEAVDHGTNVALPDSYSAWQAICEMALREPARVSLTHRTDGAQAIKPVPGAGRTAGGWLTLGSFAWDHDWAWKMAEHC